MIAVRAESGCSLSSPAMNRRSFLRLTAATSLIAHPFGRILVAGETLADPSAVAGLGLPKDWAYVEPHNWENGRAKASAGSKGVVREFRVASWDAEPIDLPAELEDVIGNADERLSLEAVNRQLDQFLKSRDANDLANAIGPLQHPGDLFQGITLIPLRFVIDSALKGTAADATALRPLSEAIREVVILRTPAHQFSIGQTIGNRIVFYGYSSNSNKFDSVGHSHIDRVAETLRDRNLRLIKQMVHMDGPAQGLTPEAIVTDGVGGSTHAGGYSAGYDREARPLCVRSDWPSGYGNLGSKTYNAHLIAIDYQGGVREKIPDEFLAAYARNADMWDCCAAMLVPFADRDINPDFRDYKYNPLEVYDQKSARAVAGALAQMNSDAFLAEHGAFYCAEGQYVVANLGPQEDQNGGTLLKQSRYGATAFGRLIDTFLAAPEYAGMQAGERKARPLIGWAYLRSLGAAGGGITEAQYQILEETDRTAIALEWLPEKVTGWQAFGPLNPEALVARPMTVATMAWALLKRYLPREGLASLILAELIRANEEGDARVKAAVTLLAGGASPDGNEGSAALDGLANKIATGFLLGLLSSDEVRGSLLQRAGFEEIADTADKQAVLAAYARFLKVLRDSELSSQQQLDKALEAADAELGALTVTRNFYNPVTQTRTPRKSTLMKYAAPACFGTWAQYPSFSGTGCMRYVATAMHADLAA